ncbi:type 1 glutamine amidotransferase [Maribacter sp. ACAM166]|uniref:type 1 glutamine amidotransferase n=1 Tax=Maribacter sp. ACAM166 TaxID=2508996 RepID=UPI0010FED47E|nr:GMP synthase [Maribacter sp. ACAM166]TLP73009.1 GMP synthase [Maribacter sp. ACAM166]
MKGIYKIAVLDMNAGQPNEGMRCITTLMGEFLTEDGVQGRYDVFEVRNGQELPDLNTYDIFVSSGGPGSPLKTGAEWEIKYFEFLDSILFHNLSKVEKKHVFLICHSFQLACLHWDVARVTKRRSTSFGIFPIYKTKSGEQEVLFKDLNDPFYAVDSRDYQVVGPKEWKLDTLDGKVLCREKNRPNVPLERAVMAIRFSNEIFGVQFHPEADAEGMLRYFGKEEKKNQIVKRHGKKKYLEMITQLDDKTKIWKTKKTLIPTFLKLAAEAIDRQKLQTV